MDVPRKLFETYIRASWKTPKVESLLVQGEVVGVNVPRPEAHARSFDG
jgi:hypothetical protein